MQLKFRGKSEKDVIIFIDGINHKVEIFEAPAEATDSHLLAEQLTEIFADNDNEKKSLELFQQVLQQNIHLSEC